ncbi:hypothetical protein D3OALGA1CA_200 [Olavius algarvensis associated proteobacterium Delta 3]|nr:hypothetical protein D3OALGA1CA_200 [Olavius algarvensis associated proteobacterium Delta 3]CAB5164674.1 hypothetical protein D3OALGB2SA_5670 [Olavius algarvensis associated proteobacterium Delta 3]
MLGARCWILDARYWILGYLMLDAGNYRQTGRRANRLTGFWMLDAGW